MKLHEKLKKLRKGKGMSQQNIADQLHISQNTYSCIEKGETKIDEQRIRQLAEIFNIHPAELFNEENTLSPNGNVNAEISNENISYTQTLNAEYKELIVQLTAQLQIKDEQIKKLTVLLEKSLK